MRLTPDMPMTALLKAMAAFQDQQIAAGKASSDGATRVWFDWEFHTRESGLDQETIKRLLPMAVAAGFAQGMGSRAAAGMRPGDGLAWITPGGRIALEELRHPAPPLQVAIESLSPAAQEQLRRLLEGASDYGVTRRDIKRVEELLEEIANNTASSRLEHAVSLVDLFQNSTSLMTFFVVVVLPFLQSVMPK